MKNHRMYLLSAAAFLALAACPLTAMASDQPGAAGDTWFEESQFPGAFNFSVYTSTNFYHDAGMALSTANITRGDGPLNKIGGPSTRNNAVLNKNDDADMYCIRISDPATFSVTTNTSPSRPDLYLFKANGTAVIGWQGMSTGGIASIAAGNLAVTSAFNAGDIAFLVITRDNSATQYNHPFNAGFQEIFPATAGLVLPDPLVMDKVLGTTEGNSSLPGNWTNDGGNPSQMFAQAYTLTLTGAGYHTTPAPSAAGLIGLGGLLAARRRRA